MNVYRERISRIQHKNWSIRVWRYENLKAVYQDASYMNINVQLILDNAKPNTSQYELAYQILGLSDINAVEVIDSNGTGEVLYKDWP